MTDVLNTLSGAVDHGDLAALLQRRPLVSRHAQGSFDALLEPTDDNDLSCEERIAAALRVARLHGSDSLALLYRERLGTLSTSKGKRQAIEQGLPLPSDSTRLGAILTHVERVSLRPAEAAANHLAQLEQAGLSTAAVVTLSQLIGFVAFQARVLAGLELLKVRP